MKKILLGAGIASTIALGSVVFTGGDIIDQVNAKVEGMFEMIKQYEKNEGELVNKINNLKFVRDNLENQVKELTVSNKNKDTQISDLNIQITELNRQIEILEQQLGNTSGIVQEITRLEGEVNKANSKVAELQKILDIQINDAPLTDREVEELLPFDGIIYFSSESEDETVVRLSSYAEMHMKKISSDDGSYEFLCTVKSTTDDAFDVSLGTDDEIWSFNCYQGSDVEFKMFLNYDYNYTNIRINNGEFKYKLVIE